jgi:hypothetical protein
MPADDPGIWTERELPAEARAIAEYALRRLRDARRHATEALLRDDSFVPLVEAAQHAARAEELGRLMQVATGDPAWSTYVRKLEADSARCARQIVAELLL